MSETSQAEAAEL
jgi:hypothetical protein